MAKKAAKGAAKPRQRSDGYWECRWTTELPDGEKKVIVVVGKSEQEAIEKRDQRKLELAKGEYVAKSGKTVKQWVDEWLNNKKLEIEPKTWGSYESLMRTHVIPDIGNYPLQKVTTKDIQLIINRLAKKTAPATVKKLYVVLSTCLEQAKVERYINSNVADFVKIPKVKQAKKKKPFTNAEINKLIEVATNDPSNKRNPCYLPALMLLIETGARASEILGLKWENVFLDKRQILIKDTISFVSSKTREAYADIVRPIEGTVILPKDNPKNDSSIRYLPISETIANLLSNLERKGEYVICTRNGTPISLRNWSRKLSLWMEDAGIKDHSTHDFRHTFVTDMIDNGESLATIQSLGGYASPRVPTSVYMHSIHRSQVNAMQRRQQRLYQK